MRTSFAALALSLLALPVSTARAADKTDAELVQMCVEELKSRQPEQERHGNTALAASSVQRSDKQIEVNIQVTEAEGRRVAGRCIIRNGKMFDFREK